jgi:plasmid stability protein
MSSIAAQKLYVVHWIARNNITNFDNLSFCFRGLLQSLLLFQQPGLLCVTILESIMAIITVKRIPDDLYERLKASAKANRRSINSEIIVCIEQAVTSRQVDPELLIAGARELRELTAGIAIDDDSFDQGKQAGRP